MSADAQQLAERLAKIRVSVRDDLDITRHVFRGDPCYVVRDPITFNTHRLSPADYHVLCRINTSQSLEDVFKQAVADGLATADQEQHFYQFVMSLHQLGFLRLPISDDKMLYRRFRMKQAAKIRQKALGILFIQVPVWNPDAFLSRTERLVRPFFTPAAFAVWVVWVLSALVVGVMNRAALADTAQGLLATSNLAVMWPTLVILKIFHEFGHAYACKRFGGHVPEMGMYLMMFTPCAYVDATASWGFPRKRERIIVALAGMYVEVAIASGALFVWAATGPGLLNAVAYNTVFLASVVTMLFNINPLMRYDGYYIFSDFVEVPNLRARAAAYTVSTLKRIALGIRDTAQGIDHRLASLLLGYGVASTMYRITILSGIAGLLTFKLGVAGLGLAMLVLGTTLFGLGRRLIRYSLFAEETRAIRVRAVAASAIPLIVIPALLGFVPAPRSVQAAAVIGAEKEATLHVETPGVLCALQAQPGATVAANQPIALLTDDNTTERVWECESQLRIAQVRAEAAIAGRPSETREWDRRLQAREAEYARATQRAAGLTLKAPFDGYVASTAAIEQVGRRLEIGAPVARLVSGAPRVRTLLSDEQMATINPVRGMQGVFRAASDPARAMTATVERIRPLGSREIPHAALTLQGGGEIPVSPDTREATQPYFELELSLTDPSSTDMTFAKLPIGATGRLNFTGESEPLGRAVWRGLLRFADRIQPE
ncbi:MAG: HlyD family efflux transporter periplasmic adaptor subunit [Phycisphaerales bacterium]|nr:HlyD family efflux transporter periplasmic adaptor subunit [Phycisphaerales bacterium]